MQKKRIKPKERESEIDLKVRAVKEKLSTELDFKVEAMLRDYATYALDRNVIALRGVSCDISVAMNDIPPGCPHGSPVNPWLKI